MKKASVGQKVHLHPKPRKLEKTENKRAESFNNKSAKCKWLSLAVILLFLLNIARNN